MLLSDAHKLLFMPDDAAVFIMVEDTQPGHAEVVQVWYAANLSVDLTARPYGLAVANGAHHTTALLLVNRVVVRTGKRESACLHLIVSCIQQAMRYALLNALACDDVCGSRTSKVTSLRVVQPI